ncbi:YdcF family protein [Macrococcus capreoli]|uniref:YdcF family protein n=1 Tax=Macrococcus capreoli TaxID=2982690 RepID=UPI003EE54FDB
MHFIKEKKILLYFLFTFFLIFFTESINYPMLNQAVKSDVIVVLDGGKGRLEKAVELYKKGYARTLIIAPENYKKEGINKNKAINYGVNPNDIIVEHKSTSTYNTIFNINYILKTNKFNSAIIVTNDYHMKRVIYIFNKYKYKNYEFYYVTSTNEKGERWFESENALNIWYSELRKNIGYRLGMYKFIDE